jgi:hypothetical protein
VSWNKWNYLCSAVISETKHIIRKCGGIFDRFTCGSRFSWELFWF